MPEVIPLESLRRGATACLFEGGDRAPVSMFVTEYPQRGQGPDLHVHPYPEVFLVQSGVGEFTAGEEKTRVAAGNFVIVPADTPHGFKNAEDGSTLRVVSVHPNPHVIQEDL
jgi:quercetin dioxygenase-like cupin family protein